MTDSEYRIGKIEDTVHNIDKRQETFEEFAKVTIKEMKERMNRMDERMDKMDERIDRMDAKMDNLSTQMHSLTVGVGVGMTSITLSVIGLIIAIFLKN